MSAPAPTVPVPVKKPYPKYLGGLAATFAASITHPLDLTNRLQTGHEKSMLRAMKNTLNVRGVRGLFDGLTGTWLRQMSYSLCRFAAYDQAKSMLHTGSGPMPAHKLVASGSIAGAVAGVVGNPGETIMVRMQNDYAKPAAERLGYRNGLQGLWRMTRDEGLRSWTRGMGPNVLRSVLMNSSQIPAYDWGKGALMKATGMKDGVPLHVAASLFSGTVATTVCSPADVIKSRMMSSSSGEGTFSTIARAFKKEGPLFMFKGWVPSWARLQPTTILIFLSLEQLKRATDYIRGPAAVAAGVSAAA